jgi:hypothetical protein
MNTSKASKALLVGIVKKFHPSTDILSNDAYDVAVLWLLVDCK